VLGIPLCLRKCTADDDPACGIDLLCTGLPLPPDGGPPADSSSMDVVDGAIKDGSGDGANEGGTPDGGTPDSGTPDAGAADAGNPEGGATAYGYCF
jgi:hypothetical protein